jgi:hypothetical protein
MINEMNPSITNTILKTAVEAALSDIIKKQNEPTITLMEAARLSSIGRDKLSSLARDPDSDFPCFTVGSKTLVNKPLFIAWLEKVSKERRAL